MWPLAIPFPFSKAVDAIVFENDVQCRERIMSGKVNGGKLSTSVKLLKINMGLFGTWFQVFLTACSLQDCNLNTVMSMKHPQKPQISCSEQQTAHSFMYQRSFK